VSKLAKTKSPSPLTGPTSLEMCPNLQKPKAQVP
jgi:hypothetical protein